ncbi:MAG TPA: Ig-like domain-containing protein [Streptosporangiaceae bacterium]|jgi:lipoprotein-anchoring transpeptidase ErfK/SrfK
MAIPAALILMTAACSGGSAGGGSAGSTPRSTPTSARLSISPANGSQDAAPSDGITVTATHGTVRHVTVTADHDPVAGTLSSDGTVWHSQWALNVARRYTVTATATDKAGQTVTATSSFRTLTPRATFQTQIFEGLNQMYGVGMPIKLTFSRPITNKAAVERSLEVTTSKPVVGAWYWDGDKSLDFRPQTYWPAGTLVSFAGHLNGVEGADGVYGAAELTQSFRIGPSVIVVASTATHHMSLYYNGHRIHYWSISTGRPGDNTPDGTYLTIEKGNPVDMKGPGYNIEVPWSVRFTWSGDYLHDAFWSVGEQGFTNVSHGCVNMAPANAETYYKMAVPGNPVTITGSPSGGVWDNGWTDWFISWNQLVSRSALHEAVEAGPNGSTFVDPATLPAVQGSSPLQSPAPDNARAA